MVRGPVQRTSNTEHLPEGKIGSYPYLSFYHCINQFPFLYIYFQVCA
jgi:hypothetical protein